MISFCDVDVVNGAVFWSDEELIRRYVINIMISNKARQKRYVAKSGDRIGFQKIRIEDLGLEIIKYNS